MTWLAVKLFLNKAWVWCKHNWKIVALLIYTILLYLLFSKNTRNAKKMLEEARKAHKAEVDALNNAHAEAIRKRNDSIKEYQDTLKIIENKLKAQSEVITKKQKERVKEIVSEAKEDPDKLAQLIKEEFGFEIYDG